MRRIKPKIATTTAFATCVTLLAMLLTHLGVLLAIELVVGTLNLFVVAYNSVYLLRQHRHRKALTHIITMERDMSLIPKPNPVDFATYSDYRKACNEWEAAYGDPSNIQAYMVYFDKYRNRKV